MKKILFITVFVCGLMLSASAADAYTKTTTKMSSNLQFTETLRRGAKNPQVLALQKKLKEFGYYNKALDSDYGSGTIAAVKQYQRSKGLVPDGNAGPKTYAMILADKSRLAAGSNIDFRKSTNPSVSSNSIICTKEYAPVCGKNQFMSQPKTYANKCMMGAAGATLVSYGACAKDATKKQNQNNVLLNNLKPLVEEVSHMNVTSNSIQLHGEFEAYTNVTGPVFFVYGQDDDDVEDVADDFNTYFSVAENGQDLQKHMIFNSQSGDFAATTGPGIISGLESGEEYFYAACIEFTNSNGNQELVCGDVEEFETLDSSLSGSYLNGCLEVTPSSISNNKLSLWDTNKLVAKFNIENNCDTDLRIDDINFDVISSYAKAQFNNIDTEIENNSVDGSTQIHAYYDSSISGNKLSFSAHPNFDGGYGLLEDGEEWVVEVYADIIGIAANNYNQRNTAFAVSVNNIEFDTGNGDEMNPEFNIWNQSIVITN